MGFMQLLPLFLKSFRQEAERLRASLLYPEVEFSRSTYQVKVTDPETFEENWCFLSFLDSHHLSDAFCSCDASSSGCPHLAFAYLSLFDHRGEMLSEKYGKSFFYKLSELWFKMGEKPRWKEKIHAISHSKKGDEILASLFHKRKEETEENSIKFSGLSDEELEDFREGKPDFSLALELSTFSDFAKRLFFMDSLEKLKIELLFKPSKLPDRLKIISDDFEIEWTMTPEEQEVLIPFLNTCNSNLKVFNRLEDLWKKISFDPKKCELKLVPKEEKQEGTFGIPIGEYVFQPNRGYFLKDTHAEKTIRKEAIEPYILQNEESFQKLLEGTKWNLDAREEKLFLEFDSSWNLHLTPYLFRPGDLQEEGAIRFKKLVFLPKAGFFKVFSKERYPEVILEQNVPEFVRSHAPCLNRYRGFEVHLGSVESQVSYTVGKDQSLTLERLVIEDDAKAHDFGQFVFIRQEGFFTKTETTFHLDFLKGRKVKKDFVAPFIRENRGDLSLIPGFFLEKSPLQEVYLELHLDESGRILIDPHFALKEEYSGKPFYLFDEWVFVEGGGFHELLPFERLPEEVRTPEWVLESGFKEFFERRFPALSPYIQKIDLCLKPPRMISLELESIEEGPYFSFFVKFSYRTEKGEIPLQQVMEALEKKKEYLFTEAGRINLVDERFQWIKRLKKTAIANEGKLQLSLVELLRLHAFEEIRASENAIRLFREVINLEKTPPFNTDGLNSILRPYQEIGGRWLFSLYNYMLGGLLCDEMGLGKTHQAMALIASVLNLKPDLKFLVACPTSVLYHWEDRIKEFFPKLKVSVYHGPMRSLDSMEGSLLLTSYGTLRSDAALFENNHFHIAFFDEIQVAKNHQSKLYHALSKVKADVKIGLTGTPIENRLRELKTLFDLVLPGYMPEEASYTRLIVNPIEKHRDMQKKSLLQRLIQPFVLRRKKVDVLLDLPSKTEEIAHTDLADGQKELYREVLLLNRDEILQDLMDHKRAIPYLHVFALLTRLKQIADHPALYYKRPLDYQKYNSGKWDLFVELLSEARESNQKVVVFSQYLGMLDIIELYLKEQGIGYASIRGSTKDRKEEVRLFTEDPTCEVFVASLKAAGLGIDLTSASCVIHYDRWWNAARENQATDRVHRIGQSRGVQVFKLVTKNTFEERIHEIIERKRELLEDAVQVDDHEVLKAFSREDLFSLLQYGIQD